MDYGLFACTFFNSVFGDALPPRHELKHFIQFASIELLHDLPQAHQPTGILMTKLDWRSPDSSSDRRNFSRSSSHNSTLARHHVSRVYSHQDLSVFQNSVEVKLACQPHKKYLTSAAARFIF